MAALITVTYKKKTSFGLLPANLTQVPVQASQKSSTTHNFKIQKVFCNIQASEPNLWVHDICLYMHLTNGIIVDTVLAITVAPAIYNSAGSLVPNILVIKVYVFKALLSSYVFGMPFLYVTRLLTELSTLLLCVLQQCCVSHSSLLLLLLWVMLIACHV